MHYRSGAVRREGPRQAARRQVAVDDEDHPEEAEGMTADAAALNADTGWPEGDRKRLRGGREPYEWDVPEPEK